MKRKEIEKAALEAKGEEDEEEEEGGRRKYFHLVSDKERWTLSTESIRIFTHIILIPDY